MARETFSMRWQVLHSKVCSSKPRLPGEIRANPILCLQVRHIGRSTMDELRIAQHPWKRYELSTNWSVRFPTLRKNFGASLKEVPERCREVRRPPPTACQNPARIAIWRPEDQASTPEIARRYPGKRRVPGGEPRPLIGPMPQAPEFLATEARAEWDRVSVQLYHMGLLTDADVSPLAVYCQAYARWLTTERAIAVMAAGAVLFLFNAIEKKPPRASPTQEFSHSLDPDCVKTFFLPQKLHATEDDPRRHDGLSIFLLYRARNQPWRKLGPR
jgi:hypothetical protein